MGAAFPDDSVCARFYFGLQANAKARAGGTLCNATVDLGKIIDEIFIPSCEVCAYDLHEHSIGGVESKMHSGPEQNGASAVMWCDRNIEAGSKITNFAADSQSATPAKIEHTVIE